MCVATKEIIACGEVRGRIMIADWDADWTDEKNIKWQWTPGEDPNLTAEEKKLFQAMDECKPCLGLSHILVTASYAGAVALLEKSTKKLKFLARGVNAHSAELLPDGNIAAALSGGGDVVKVHCTLPGSDLAVSYPLTWGHGVVWDKKRQVLWAMGKDEIRSYEYNMNRNDPALKLKKSFKIPGHCGHELFPRAGKDALFFTEETGVFEFNAETGAISEFPSVKGSIKSFCENGPDGRIVYQKAANGLDKKCYWNDKLYFLNPAGENILPGERFYKARWNCVNEFSY
jgi:hypothetical protein